ncbi:MAG: HlyD family efflux transporter periplasmic adaptor subunit, partial [Eubacteriales bacterium]|nr:HlyD family efflux transporter periplasmic adaptor subunit [Eubacteriales bacterium]
AAAVKSCGLGEKTAENTSTYTFDTAVRTSIIESLSGTGTLEPADKYTVTTLLKGDILTDSFEEGDIVEADQVLYQIDSSDMQTTIERAEISAKSAQRSYETAVKDLDNLNVKTKVGGVVTDVLVEVGDQVSAGQEIAKVRDSATMTIELPFPADEADTFYIGQSAQVTLYGSFETLSGKVESISGASEVQAGNKIVKNVTINVENPGAISEEQIATAEVGTSGSTQSGKFKYNENRSVNAEVSGEVVAIVNDEGSEVSSGSTIIRLESDNVTNSVQSASDSVKDAQLSLENQYETLEDYTIKSPIKGTVIEKKKKAGDTIDSNAELCTIYDLSYLKMTMNIDELDISKVKVGQEVTVTADAVQGQTFKGKVTKINMAGTTTNGVTTYPVEVQIEDTEGLLPGMNVSTEIIVNQVEDVVAIPVGAVVRGDKVLVKTGNTSTDDPTVPAGYEYVNVETGVSNDQYVEIKSGINEGDEIAYIFSASANMDMYGGYGGEMMVAVG